MAKTVAKLGLKREDGYLYFIDKDGDVARTLMAQKKQSGRKKKAEKVPGGKVGIKKESGFLYFLDKKGDVSCAPMVRRKAKGGKKKKKR